MSSDLNPNTTYGAVVLSSFISAGLFGFTFLQTYTFFIHKSSRDHAVMKLGILLLWLADGLQVVFLVWAVYYYMVINYFSPNSLDVLRWQVPLTWFMSNLGSFIAEAYFVPQIYTLTGKNKWLSGILAIAILASAVVLFGRMIRQLNQNMFGISKQCESLMISQQVFAIIANNLIAGVSIIYNYYESGFIFRDAGWIDGVLKILLDYGVLSGVMQVVYLCVYLQSSASFLWLPYQVTGGKLLVNALLARLNARGNVAGQRDELGFNLGHLDVRQDGAPINNQVRVVTKTIVEPDATSISSKADTAMEGRLRSGKM